MHNRGDGRERYIAIGRESEREEIERGGVRETETKRQRGAKRKRERNREREAGMKTNRDTREK